MNDGFKDDGIIDLGNVRMSEATFDYLLDRIFMRKTIGIDGTGLAENDRGLFLHIRDIVSELNPDGYYFLDDPEDRDAYDLKAGTIFWMIKTKKDSNTINEYLSEHCEYYHPSPDEYQCRREAAAMKLSQLKDDGLGPQIVPVRVKNGKAYRLGFCVNDNAPHFHFQVGTVSDGFLVESESCISLAECAYSSVHPGRRVTKEEAQWIDRVFRKPSGRFSKMTNWGWAWFLWINALNCKKVGIEAQPDYTKLWSC